MSIRVRPPKLAMAPRGGGIKPPFFALSRIGQAIKSVYRHDRIDDTLTFATPIWLPDDFEFELSFTQHTMVRANGNNQVIVHALVGSAPRPLLFYNSWGNVNGRLGTYNSTGCRSDGSILGYPGFTYSIEPNVPYTVRYRRVAGDLYGELVLPSGEVIQSSRAITSDPGVYQIIGPSPLPTGSERADVSYHRMRIWNRGTRENGVLVGDWDFSNKSGLFLNAPAPETNMVNFANVVWESSSERKVFSNGIGYKTHDTWGQRAWRLPISLEWSRTYVVEMDTTGWPEGHLGRLLLNYTGVAPANAPFDEVAKTVFDLSSSYYGSYTSARVRNGILRFVFTTGPGTGLMPGASISVRGHGSDDMRVSTVTNFKVYPAYEMLGPELIRNPTLTDLSGTYAQAGGVLSSESGALRCDFLADTQSGVDLYLASGIELIPGRYYKLECDVLSLTTPIRMGVRLFAPSWSTTSFVNIAAARQKVELIFCARAGNYHVTFRPVLATAGSFVIDNITLRELSHFRNYAVLGNSNADRWADLPIGREISRPNAFYDCDGVDDRGQFSGRLINPDGNIDLLIWTGSALKSTQVIISQSLSANIASREFQLWTAANTTQLYMLVGGASAHFVGNVQPERQYRIVYHGSTVQLFDADGQLVRTSNYVRGAVREPDAKTNLACNADGASFVNLFRGPFKGIEVNGLRYPINQRGQSIQLPYPAMLGAELITQEILIAPAVKGTQWSYEGNGRWKYVGDGSANTLRFLTSAAHPVAGYLEFEVESYSGTGQMRCSSSFAPANQFGNVFSGVGIKRYFYTAFENGVMVEFQRLGADMVVSCVIKNISFKPLGSVIPLVLFNTNPDRWKDINV